MHVIQEIEELTLDLKTKSIRVLSLLLWIPLTLSMGYGESFEEQLSISQKNRDEISLLKQQVAELTERLDGVTTLIEGFNGVIEELKQPKNQKLWEETEMRLNVLEAKVALLSKGNLSELPDNNSSEENLTQPKAEPKEETTPKLSTLPKAKLYSQGVRLFLKHKYSDAKERFMITKTKNYKPAASNYYLGEIAYSTQRYEDAINYFKKSIQIYDQANYNDILLLHTAISLEKIGDKEEAKSFYKILIENYPNKPTTSTAKENLKNL